MVVKAGLGIIGLSAISIGGVAVVKPHLLGMDYMPTFHALSKDKDFSSSSSYTNKIGSTYKNYLVGVTTKKDQETKTNKAWWEWAFRKLQVDKPKKGKFKHEGKKDSDLVTMPYASDDQNEKTKALNQVCKEAYGKSENELKENSVGDDSITDSDVKKSDFWKYCSPLGEAPKKVTADSSGSNIGSVSNGNFASVEEGVNRMFWIIREKEIRGGDDNFETITITNSSSDTYFQNKDETLRELCGKAYQQPTSGNNQPDAQTTKKYCEISIPQSQ